MPRSSGPFRQRTKVELADADFTIRVASIDDLIRVNQEAVLHRWRNRWSSEEAVRRQVGPEESIIICPLFRNGGLEEEPESYYCWIWYSINAEENARGVSLADVGRELFSTLPEISSPEELKQTIRIIFQSVAMGSRIVVIE